MKKLAGKLFLVNENAAIFLQCFVCMATLTRLHDKFTGVCRECLEQAGVQVGVVLVVEQPTENSRWN